MQELVEVAEGTHIPKVEAVARAELASLRVRMGRQQDVEKPIKEALTFLTESGEDLDARRNFYMSLSRLKEMQGNSAEALEYFKKKADLDLRIEILERENSIEKVRLRMEFDKSETERKLLEVQKEKLEEANRKLSEALEQIRTLSGMLPICSHCKKIRNDSGYWEQLEKYISAHSAAEFSHSLCPACAREFYPEFIERD
jgi:tetratricopeptide (TPR) repeat protein